MDLSRSISSNFVRSCRFWLAANSIWAAFVVAGAATVAIRLPIAKSWPFIALAITVSAVVAFRELRKIELEIQGASLSNPRTWQQRIPSLALFEQRRLCQHHRRHLFI